MKGLCECRLIKVRAIFIFMSNQCFYSFYLSLVMHGTGIVQEPHLKLEFHFPLASTVHVLLIYHNVNVFYVPSIILLYHILAILKFGTESNVNLAQFFPVRVLHGCGAVGFRNFLSHALESWISVVSYVLAKTFSL